MKKAKRILIIALISMMATFFLIGCGEAEQETSSSQSSYTITFDSDGGRKVQKEAGQGRREEDCRKEGRRKGQGPQAEQEGSL